MKKKRLVAPLLAASIILSASLGGCSLVSTNTQSDYEQVIATVNISKASGLTQQDEELIDTYASALDNTEIIKRDLLAYYINVGQAQVQQGSSVHDVMVSLMDSLVNTAVVAQYAIVYLLNEKAGTSAPSTVLEEYNSKTTYSEKLEYLLGEDSVDVMVAEYSVRASLNSAIDSYEKQILKIEDDKSGDETRTAPTGVDTETEDYYPATSEGDLDYNVYTGGSAHYADSGKSYDYRLSESGAYKNDALEGTRKVTRLNAYNRFVSNLIANDLVDPEKEDIGDVRNLDYIEKEYAKQLEQRVIEKYYDLYEKEMEEKLKGDERYVYIDKVYEDIKGSQTADYESDTSKTSDKIKTAMDNMSDTSFVLYSPDTNGEGTYGFVYNILLPYSSKQSALLDKYRSDDVDDDKNITPDYYTHRNELLKNLTTYDRRAAWFNGVTDYSFSTITDKNGDARATDDPAYLLEYYGKQPDKEAYLFFENNLVNSDRYEQLEKYYGRYPFNGAVTKLDNGTYDLGYNYLDIDDMLKEFKGYVDYVMGKDGVSFEDGYSPESGNESYYKVYDNDNLYTAETKDEKKFEDKEVDYSNFIYAKGKVELGLTNQKENRTTVLYDGTVLDENGKPVRNWENASDSYKALSAVNELQFAYTTDTSVLSEYIGYTVTLGDTTNYIKEFAYAAQEAISRGAGAFNVCAGDYGWHIIYVTYVLGEPDGDNNPGGEEFEPDWAGNIDKVGTFENLFYEWVKNNDIPNVSSTRRTQILTQYKKDETVIKYQERYQDLLDAGN